MWDFSKRRNINIKILPERVFIVPLKPRKLLHFLLFPFFPTFLLFSAFSAFLRTICFAADAAALTLAPLNWLQVQYFDLQLFALLPFYFFTFPWHRFNCQPGGVVFFYIILYYFY